jgi:TRAP-type mannitol/chloroaromatic compound transport system substrate-binding protein
MEIELYFADQLVPTGELFRAMQQGTIDAVQSDDDSIAAPVDVSVFGGYFPFASRYSLDVPVLFNYYGLKEIWEEAYGEVEGVTWLGAGAWDPCNFATVDPIRSLADLEGKRVFTFPTAGRFLQRFGVVPVTLPWEDIEVAVQTGELDGVAWSGITEDYTVGWADVTNYYLTNNISGAWCGSYFANTEKWEALPEHLKTLFRLCMDSSHYYRQYWYWWGEAHYRTTGGKLELTSIPESEWQTVEEEAMKFWDEIAAESERSARVVQILKDYRATMVAAGPPYRCA